MSKTWQFQTDSSEVQKALQPFSKCKCPQSMLPHESCAGQNAHLSEFYPPTLCDALVLAAKRIATNPVPCSPVDKGSLGKLASASKQWKQKLVARPPISAHIPTRNLWPRRVVFGGLMRDFFLCHGYGYLNHLFDGL